jgi:hypothetical protein
MKELLMKISPGISYPEGEGVLYEWRGNHWCFGISIESDWRQSSWYFVTDRRFSKYGYLSSILNWMATDK